MPNITVIGASCWSWVPKKCVTFSNWSFCSGAT